MRGESMVSSISGINNNMDINIKASQSKAQQNEFEEMLKQVQEEKDEKKLMEACKNLESVFVNMMFKQMQSTVQKTGLTDGGYGEEIYNDMLLEKYAEEATKGSGLGLAQVMYKQLSMNFTKKSEG
jgi:flagellar protein FlgJ